MTTGTNAESVFLYTLFQSLQKAQVRYAVMRNHESLPYSAAGSDLDILVAATDKAQAKAAVLGAIHSVGGTPIGIAESFGFFKIYALGKSVKTDQSWWGLRLDFNVGLYYKGQHLLDEKVGWPIRNHRDIPVLSDGFAGVLGVLKEALNNGIFSRRYAQYARIAAISEWPGIETLLAPMGPQALSRLRSILISEASPKTLVSECRKLRKDLFRHSLSRRGIKTLWHRASYEWFKVRRYLTPSGAVVAIMGVDGAGKSAMIDAILPVLNAATHNAVTVQHLRPTLLPTLARLKGKKHTPAGPVLEPHGASPSGLPGSLFRLTYLTLDYLLGYWLLTRPKIAKQPAVVLFDRYAYDMAIDPRRFRIGVSGRLPSLFCALAPEPELILCLHASPETIASRKRELPLSEIRRQTEALKAFAENHPKAILVSNEDSLEALRDRVMDVLLNFFTRRWKRRNTHWKRSCH